MNPVVKSFSFAFIVSVVIYILIILMCGCGTTVRTLTDSASSKNLAADGYLMMGSIETANPETATPQGRLLIGRVAYKSRKVGIPADQKVPTAGNFRATHTKSLFGTEETIIEYDFTAGSDADAQEAMRRLEEKRMDAERKIAGQSATGVDTDSRPAQ